VSLNSIMVDATGMCGGCRVSINGVSKFACVEGPEFDGHEVDFDELMTRQSAYAKHEHESMQCFLRDKK
jgi:ferredoxin--NADP+ reductase